ncbi:MULTISPECIES: GntR family transcriptional regulator [Enterobacteriaceae]|jgi:DNA-binding GntR family transcriptional regulator|uniref:GntR family transcriptional regulator n=1 Tax=Enterobacteriaceae TaxID=543 RepID=UPI000707E18D|nr:MULTISPECIES: GntR family transcriptional regulator [Enterobacteriaceae]EMC9755383.1 GntR family transcriptional regulator [Enterobacter cloacae]HBV8601992.1 GntR family transcriptional regulator [Klebsiella oxytoca]HEM8824701.1 GntR family transcriptional regulator [Raoultella planticola]EFD4874295.1 GntR family transcriptional regulator [Escherichia coli]EFE0887860.1 GntR family transcriptional regulator [Escherichia coli]
MLKPRYMQIADLLTEQIKDGTLTPGAMMPTEAELQATYDVSRVTIRKAMKVLVDNDLLYRVRGSGSYVKAPKAQHNAFQLMGFIEEVSAQGKTPSSKVIAFETSPCSHTIASKLNVEEGTLIYEIQRLRLIDGEPEILECTYLPVAMFTDLSIEVMQTSKYDYIERHKGMQIAKSRQCVWPDSTSTSLAALLNTRENSPILRVESVSELVDGTPFEYTVNYFRLYQYSFEFIAHRQTPQ